MRRLAGRLAAWLGGALVGAILLVIAGFGALCVFGTPDLAEYLARILGAAIVGIPLYLGLDFLGEES